MFEDFDWFEEHYKELQETYGNSFIAIKQKKVIGVYSSYAEGVKNTALTEPLGSFIIQECNKDYEAYRCCIASMNFR